MKKIKALVAALSSSLLVACASQTASNEVSFPKLSSSYLKTGAFIEPEVFERVQPGLDRDQVRLLLGNPHFNEGLIAKNKWNYAFNFKTGQANEYITCQYQVVFENVENEKKPQPISHAESIPTRNSLMVAEYWESPTCEALVRATVTEEQPELNEVSAQTQSIEIGSDALFSFAGSKLKDLNAAGIRSLDELINKINSDYIDVESIHIVGHTDRIGSAEANYKLSLARANTVAEYLSNKGILRHIITTEGRGLTEPVTDCGMSKVLTSELIECLKPNRRVVLEIKAKKIVR